MYLPENSRTDPRVNSLRILLRGLHHFRSYYQAEGEHEIIAPNGSVWSLFDIEYLYETAMRRPAVVVPVETPASDVPLGHYVQHSGAWCRVLSASTKASNQSVSLELSNGKAKKCAKGARVLALSPQQKQLIDYDRDHPCLPLRQQQAIELFLVLNLPEDEAALRMGLARTNPIGMYATSGLTRLLKLMDSGQMARFADSDQMLMVG